MLSIIEETRLRVSKSTAAIKKSQLGQFFTPAKTAQFMAGLFTPTTSNNCRLLDPGAGIGSLSSAFLERFCSKEFKFGKIEIAAFELDDSLHQDLRSTLTSYVCQTPFSFEIIGGNFIEEAVNRIQFNGDKFTHAILNPPYKKINSDSRHRYLLRQVGIETVNLYSAFVALSIMLMEPGAQVVAIIPRSFCNGPYYRPFRDFILKHTAIRHIHLFDSRNKAFKDDDVLQENVIIMLECGGQQNRVTVSTSTDDSFDDLAVHTYPFDRIVIPDDPEERFIYVPTSPKRSALELSSSIRCTLDGIGISVSTGPVVDFRLKEYLRDMPEPGTIPLLYPGHFSGLHTEWPKPGSRRPNAIECNSQTEKWFYPNGFYCLVRRFSSKEEKRRIVASVVRPSTFGNAEMLGFENHLNVFHEQKHGLPEALAYGLAVYLNTKAVDENIRCFNGHTQVNAADLRSLKYPSRDALINLGNWAMLQEEDPTSAMYDEQIVALTT